MAPSKAAAKGTSAAKDHDDVTAKRGSTVGGKAKLSKKKAASKNFDSDDAADGSASLAGESTLSRLEPEVSLTLSSPSVAESFKHTSSVRSVSPEVKEEERVVKTKPKVGKGKTKSAKEPPRVYLEYHGPRPDEVLLSAVASEIQDRDRADIEWIYQLMRNGEGVNQRSELGATSLQVAAAAGNGPLVSILLERGADARLLTIHKGELAMHHAARNGNRVCCQLVAEPTMAAGMINYPNSIGWPPLHIACAAGHAMAFNVLLKNGADLNIRNELLGGATALHMAIRARAADVAEVLMDNGAYVDAVDVSGRAALHFAAARADCPCVSLLLRYRADPLRQDGHGQTALDCVLRDSPGGEKVVPLLQAYMRPPPTPMRADARFDKVDAREIMPNTLQFLERKLDIKALYLPSMTDDISL